MLWGKAAGAASHEVPYWTYVAESEIAVTGVVVDTDPVQDPLRPERVSRLAVGRVLYGNAAPGDTIAVLWSGTTWHYDYAIVATGPQLDTLAGQPALFLLRCSRDGAFALDGPPAALTDDSIEELRELLWPLGISVEDAESIGKLGAVRAYLEGYVDGLAAKG